MAKFRKKPVVIEAVQLRWDNWNEICEFAGVDALSENSPQGCYIDSATGEILPQGQTSEEMGIVIPTLEGIMVGRRNDWIIKGVNGELYPCKPYIFEKTYEAVKELTDEDFAEWGIGRTPEETARLQNK